MSEQPETDSLPKRGDRFVPEGWYLVYQGGHHNVYCNGSHHVRTYGGRVGISPPDYVTAGAFTCDCHVWD